MGNEKSIDEAYDNLLNIASNSDPSSLEKSMKQLKKLQDSVNTLSDPMKLTDEEIDALANKLNEVQNNDEELKKLLDMSSNNGVLETSYPDEEIVAEGEVKNYDYDPVLGKLKETEELSEINNESFENILDDDFSSNIQDIEFKESDIKLTHLMMLGLKEEDKEVILPILNRYQKDSEVKYNELPSKLKETVYKLTLQSSTGKVTKPMLNFTAGLIIGDVCSDIITNQYQIEFQEALDKINRESAAELGTIYDDMITGRKNSMYELASKIEKDNPEKADTVRAIGDASEESYTLVKFKEAIKNHKIKIKKIDIEKVNNTIRDFNKKYEKSRFNIRDMFGVPHILYRHLNNNFTMDDIIIFVVCFCKYCFLYKPENLAEHTFMSFFVSNVYSLDMKATVEEATDQLHFIDSISEAINIMKESYSELITNGIYLLEKVQTYDTEAMANGNMVKE